MQNVEFAAGDGLTLGGTLFRPDAPNGAAVVIHAASGVKQEYYAKFAAFLADQGFTALTFDYRGIGRSRPKALRGFRARMQDWAALDAAGALRFLEQAAPGERVLVVGHSFGGQCLGVIPGNERYAGLLAVASQSGYWRHWPGLGRIGMWLATHVVLPGLSRLLGYFPARRLGQGEDLPEGVAREWASWCRHPGYIVGALDAKAQYAQLTMPLRAVWLADDAYAPLPAVRALLGFYPAASGEIVEVYPRMVGAEKIGHFGFFRERFRDTLWQAAADWLKEKK
jgi:predicted alpha/beta hydrolase